MAFEPNYDDQVSDMEKREWITKEYDTLSQSQIVVNGTVSLRYAMYTKGSAKFIISNSLSASNLIVHSAISISNG